MNPARRFLFRLALESGYWIYNPEAMAARMPARILREWRQYYSIEPFGERRADLRAGIIAATVANRFRKRGEPVARIEKFLPKFGPREDPTPQRLFDKMKAINMAFGGKFTDKRKK